MRVFLADLGHTQVFARTMFAKDRRRTLVPTDAVVA